MQEAKKNVILRVFRTAHCPPGKYFFGVTCSALSVLLSGVPFYTVYRIIRLFLLASLDGAAAPTHEIWMWAAVTIGSIVLGIVLSVIGSFSCHACAFNALYDLRMRLLDHMGRLNLGFYTGGQSGATQKMMNENIEKMENIIAHDVSNIFGAGLLLAALAVLMFSLNIPLALTIFIALVLAFLIQFSAFGGKQGQKIWSDLNRSSTELDAAFSEYVAGMEEEKIFGRPEAAARRLTGLVEKNREHWKVYLKRVTPIFGAYKTITISVLAFLLVSGCALLYLHPGDHELMLDACRKARCHDFVSALPEGYDTVVGEGGATLSGGERQRISLARAFLKDVPILLLDEPTASLDADNEAMVQRALDEISKERTIIMIAHRLKTVRGAQQILVLENGRITQKGTHNQLVGTDGLYSRLWELQNQAGNYTFKQS